MFKVPNKNIVNPLLSSSIGNVLTWYEYTIYVYLASVIGKLFFSMGNSHRSAFMAFTVLAIGIASRPIGGVIFGHISDRYSRKKMLIVAILLQSTTTLCIGLLPTYEEFFYG